MNRRSFLGFLGAVPLVAPSIAAAAVQPGPANSLGVLKGVSRLISIGQPLRSSDAGLMTAHSAAVDYPALAEGMKVSLHEVEFLRHPFFDAHTFEDGAGI